MKHLIGLFVGAGTVWAGVYWPEIAVNYMIFSGGISVLVHTLTLAIDLMEKS